MIYPWKSLFYCYVDTKKTDHNQINTTLSFVDPTLVWAKKTEILQHRPHLTFGKQSMKRSMQSQLLNSTD